MVWRVIVSALISFFLAFLIFSFFIDKKRKNDKNLLHLLLDLVKKTENKYKEIISNKITKIYSDLNKDTNEIANEIIILLKADIETIVSIVENNKIYELQISKIGDLEIFDSVFILCQNLMKNKKNKTNIYEEIYKSILYSIEADLQNKIMF